MQNLTLTQNAKNRIFEIIKDGEFVRVSLIGGGCHGFSYKFAIDKNVEENDFVLKDEVGRVMVVIKGIFLEKLKNPQIDFIKNLSSSYFVLESQNFETKCGCGTSFSLKSEI